jgi:hypothetical protein
MADWLGYAASLAVLATFLMRTMRPLRLVAILSNILFGKHPPEAADPLCLIANGALGGAPAR